MARRIRWVPHFVKVRLRRWVIEPLVHRFGYVQPSMVGRDVVRPWLHAMHPVETQFPLIRLGPPEDGGYLVPDDLDGITACFSPGVGYLSAFEEDCAQRGMRVFMADRSVDGPSSSHPSFHFIDRYIGLIDSEEYITLDTWIDSSVSPTEGDLILQMDIEGAEWLALANISRRNLVKFRIIVVELHAFDSLIYWQFFKLRGPVLERLLDDFVCVHLHPNNDRALVTHGSLPIPPVLEMTLLRKDRAQVTGYCSQFPHPLDRDNTSKPPVVLPRSLYRQD